MAALDADADGILSATEIASAPAALLTLDKNNDGQLTPDELYGGRGGMGGQLPPAGNGPGGRGPGGPGAQPVFAALDANLDGVIDAQEIASAPAALLTLDKNNDGQLTPDELYGPRGGRGGQQPPAGDAPGGPPPQAVINALDANHDGVIDTQEIAKASEALLTLDKNKDGQLTPDELR
jgi:Ca2+-binding EF-hand superfamily protein